MGREVSACRALPRAEQAADWGACCRCKSRMQAATTSCMSAANAHSSPPAHLEALHKVAPGGAALNRTHTVMGAGCHHVRPAAAVTAAAAAGSVA